MLRTHELEKTFLLPGGNRFRAVADVGFHIAKGEFFTLLGPSGCGKTTTLRCIAGLERPDSGSITIGKERVFDGRDGIFVPPNKRQIGMVFQSYAIWPHMNVFENVAFPLRVSTRLSRQEIRQRVRRALETVHMPEYENRPATKLSGGQQQRLALARALVVEPDLLLLDEPLSNLDAKLRESMRFELRRLQREVGVTTVFVTHDQAEALALSDKVAVMNEGSIQQIGPPEDIYHRPGSAFVASFIGSTNLLPATRVADAPAAAGETVVDTALGRLRAILVDGARRADRIVVSIRPETVMLGPAGRAEGSGPLNRLDGRVVERLFVGEIVDYVVAVKDVEFRVRGISHEVLPQGSEVRLEIRPDHCMVLPAA